MSFMTPSGLKVRLDANALEKVIYPLIQHDKMDKVLRELETWYNLPAALGTTVAAIAALTMPSSPWYGIILAAIVGYSIGEAIVALKYMNFLRWFIPSRLLVLAVTIMMAFYEGFSVNIYVLLGVLACSWLGLFNFITMPFNLMLSQLRRKHSNIYIGDVERNFVAICNKHAKDIGCELDWNLYKRA